MNYILFSIWTVLLVFCSQLSFAQNAEHDFTNRIRIAVEQQKDASLEETATPIVPKNNNTNAEKIGEGWDKDFGRYEVGGDLEHTGHAELDEMHYQLQDLKEQLAAFKLIETELQTEVEQLKSNLAICCSINNLSDNKPSTAYLMQNMPNPFQKTSTIQYFLPDEVTTAQLQIRDLNGKVLQTFILKERGMGELKLDRSGLTSGSYIYTLEADEKMLDSKIMILMQ